MIDPLAWMYAAVKAVGEGEAGEIEAGWDWTADDGNSASLRITVRREVQSINYRLPGPDED